MIIFWVAQITFQPSTSAFEIGESSEFSGLILQAEELR